MIGRGIDQVLSHPSAPHRYESYMHTATGYVEMAEAVHRPIPKPVDAAYIWGDALDAFGRVAPDVRIINLETAVTTSEAAWPGKGIHYRVHPENISCLTVAKIDCCVLSNNHVLDWGYTGLIETVVFVTMEPRTGKLSRVEMVPMQIQRFRAHHVTQDDARWLTDRLNREGSRFGTRVELHEDHTLMLHWDEGDAEAETRQS